MFRRVLLQIFGKNCQFACKLSIIIHDCFVSSNAYFEENQVFAAINLRSRMKLNSFGLIITMLQRWVA